MVAVYTGSGNLMDGMFNTEITQGTKKYLMSQYDNFRDNSRFSDIVKSSFDRMSQFTSSTAVRLRESITTLVGGRWDEDIVKELVTIRDHQLAKGVMQRWVMANPVVRERLVEQRCNGYSATYEDPNPKVSGKYHDDYRCVKTGLIQIYNETGEWVSTSYHCEQASEEEPLLRLDERAMIYRSWLRQTSYLMANDEDPTSPEGNDL